MTRAFQGTYNGGILSATMHSRPDVSKYQSGVKDAVNFTIMAQGGLENRPGTTVAGGMDTGVHHGAPHWLIPFTFNVEDAYMLEFGSDAMRVIKDGAYVLDGSTAPASILGVTSEASSELTLPDLVEAGRFSTGDLGYVQDPNGNHFLHNQVVRIRAVNGTGLWYELYDRGEVNTTTDTSVMGAGATISRIYQVDHPYAQTDLPEVAHVQDVDTVFLVHGSYEPQMLKRIADDEWTFTDLITEPVGDPPNNALALAGQSFSQLFAPVSDITRASPGVLTLGGVLLYGPNPDGSTMYIRDVNGMTEVNGNVYHAIPTGGSQEYELYDIDDNAAGLNTTGFSNYTSGGEVYYDLFAQPHVGSGDTEYKYQITAIVNGEESVAGPTMTCLNDLTVEGNQNIIGFSKVDGGTSYRIYKSFNGLFGYVGQSINGFFIDENITPDTSQTPPVARDPFEGVNNKPRVAAFLEQRLTLASTINNPQVFETSTSVSPTNFSRAFSPVDSDAISFRIRAQTMNDIVAIIPADPPLIFTRGAEWLIDARDDKGYLTPSNPVVRPRSYHGSAVWPKPLIIGESVLYVQRDGNTIREHVPAARPLSPDLTLLCRHLFRGRKITSWTYAQSPDSIVWVTLDDGSLYSMTYLVEHEVWGWTRQKIGGVDTKVLQVSAIPEGAVDRVYLVVERTVEGDRVRVTEKITDRVDDDLTKAYYVDAGFLTVLDAPTTQLRGYIHLRNQSVSALVDGVVVEGLTVDQFGNLTLPFAANVSVAVGLGYTSSMTTLGVDFGMTQNLGSTIGRLKSTSEMAVMVENTAGGEIKREDGGFFTDLSDGTELLTTTHLPTIEGDWVRDARITLQQRQPLPMRVLGIAPEWEVEDSYGGSN